MKKILSLIISFLISLTGFGGADAKTTYKDIFKKDSVIDVKIEIDEADLQDMRNYPENEEYHTANISVDGVEVQNVGIRTKGNMTLRSVANSDSERYSYRIKFNKYVKGNKLLGLDELCLNNGYSDPSYMREYLHYEVLRELGMNVPETVFCNVYINGEYAGLYLGVEGLDDTFLKENFGEDYKDGNFYKMEEGSTLQYKENEDYSYAELKSGSDDDLSSFKEFVKALNSVETGEKGNIESFLDVDSALKYIASNTVLCNYDSYNGNMHHNFYLYEDKNGVFTVVPWDFNMSFGGFNGSNATVGIDTPYISGSYETLPLIGKLLSVPEYKEKYYEYINEICDMLENFSDRVSELKNIIAPYVKNDSTSFYTYEQLENATSSQSTSTNDRQKGKPFGGDSSIITCVSERIASIKSQLSGESSKTTEAVSGGRNNGELPPDKRENKGMGENGNPPEPSQNGERNNPPEKNAMQEGALPQLPQGDNNTPPDIPQGMDDRPHDMFRGEENLPGQKNENNKNNDIRVHVNGHIITFDKAPYIKNDLTFVGFRAILESLGAEVKWDESTKTVTASKDGTTIKLVIGETTAYVNGETYELAAAPEISDGSTMIPLRFISEKLGMNVTWDENTRLICVNSKK